jgi:DNA-binding transcriptional regulator YhcF (GntR family)
MRFWFVHSDEVSLREQICTQVTLGIASGELKPGERLPSTRELARRFGLHPNTVSAAYSQLQQEKQLERRHGSGVYVARTAPFEGGGPGEPRRLDRMIADFLTAARAQGFAREAVVERVRRWMEVKPPDHFLLVEPEEERREIVLAELRDALRFPVRGCGFENCVDAVSTIALALPSKAAQARASLPPAIELITLQVTSVPQEMREWLPVPPEALVGICSRWPEFIKIARTMLISTGFSPDALVEKIRGEPGWVEGLLTTAAVVCDSATAPRLPSRVRAVPFRLVSEATLAELRRMEAGIEQQLE